MATPIPSPEPPTSRSPTWARSPRVDMGETTTNGWQTQTEEDHIFSEWPWWWWIAATAAGTVLLIGIMSLFACFCCRGRKRRSKQATAQCESAEVGTLPTDFRRMDSHAAKRYLYNVTSVASWGSDFEGDGTTVGGPRPQSAMYANTQVLGIRKTDELVPPPRPPKGSATGHHYLNTSSLRR